MASRPRHQPDLLRDSDDPPHAIHESSRRFLATYYSNRHLIAGLLEMPAADIVSQIRYGVICAGVAMPASKDLSESKET